MQITRLSLLNVRAIREIDLDLGTMDGSPRRRVVLLGANGAGKTTLLDAIAHTIQSLDRSSDGLGAKLLGAGDVRDIPPSLTLGQESRAGEIHVWAAFLDHERQRLRAHRRRSPTTGDFTIYLGGAGRRRSPLPVADPGVVEATSPPTEAVPTTEEEQRARFLRTAMNSFLSKNPRHGVGPFAEAASFLLQEARPPAVLLAADRGVLEFRDDLHFREVLPFDVRRDCLSKERARFAPVAVRLALAWNNERNDPNGAAARMWKVLAKYFPELPVPIHVDGLMLWFRNRDGLAVPLPSLSDGERAILLIFAEVAFRAPEEGIVLIDEIEQHLHPRWQRAVLEGLSALVPTAQLIVTSQSPYIAASAPDDVLKVGDWDRDGA